MKSIKVELTRYRCELCGEIYIDENSADRCCGLEKHSGCPLFVALGTPSGTALRLRYSYPSLKYYRPGGDWEIDFNIREYLKTGGRLKGIISYVPYLHGKSLYPIKREQFIKDNGGYAQ